MFSLFVAIFCLLAGSFELATGHLGWAALDLGLFLANLVMFKVNLDND